jgi:hypothetical protein
MAQHDGKIFGIGFYKTGTTTLYDALRLLGYYTINGDKLGSYPGADDGATLIKQIDAGDYRLPTFEMFDAFTDNPYFRIWRQIYDLYPDAKYILTVRDEQRWIDSCVKFFRHRRMRPMREWMFGAHANPSRGPESRQAWLDAYRAHNAAVREFFASRGHQYFEFDPTREGKWDRLCAFLGAPVPDRPWPHANPTQPDQPWRPMWRRLRRSLGIELRDPSERDES